MHSCLSLSKEADYYLCRDKIIVFLFENNQLQFISGDFL